MNEQNTATESVLANPDRVPSETQAESGEITSAATHLVPRVASGLQRTVPSPEGVANVIEAAKRDESPAAPASDQNTKIATEVNTMEFTTTPPKLPLDPTINRCLAHGDKKGEWCDRRDQCACHVTIRHDTGASVPTAYRKCMTDAFAAYIPITGFRDEA